MTITLSPDVETLVAKHTGEGIDVDAVLKEALLLLDEKKEYDRKLAELKAMIAEADADFAAGRYHELTPEFMQELKAEARRRHLSKSA